jgi:hypothetical protein
MDIVQYDVANHIVQACGLVDTSYVRWFQLPPNAVSSWELFASSILARWAVLRSFLRPIYRGVYAFLFRPRWINDEDYTDYLPGFYGSLEDLDNKKLQIIRGFTL